MAGHSVSLRKDFGSIFRKNVPIYEVTSYGTTLEYTQMFSEAESAYNKSRSGDTKLFIHTQSTGHKTILKQKSFVDPKTRATMSQLIKEANNVEKERKRTFH